MKILIAAEGPELESSIAKRFGHAKYYLIYDSISKDFETRTNKGHDDNHSELAKLVDEGVTHFVIGNIGPYAFDVLNKLNAKIYLLRKNTGKEALDKLFKNELKELSEPTLKNSIEPH